MKKLLNTLFVLTDSSYLKLEGEDIVVEQDGTVVGKYPLHIFESIFCFSYAGATPALIGKCCQAGISVSFFSPSGKFLYSAFGGESGNVLLRHAQYRLSDDDDRCLILARNTVAAKLHNSRWTLERYIRDHEAQVDVEALRLVSTNLKKNTAVVQQCVDKESLLGIEGDCARQYFGVFDQMILDDSFHFSGRNRRPPQDEINALLSFGYTLLGLDYKSGLVAAGVDPFVGYYHVLRSGRYALALDLVEELRSPFVDRFVLTLVNKHYIDHADFSHEENGVTLLSETGRKKFLSNWQERKKKEILHPFIQEKIPWGLVPYVQALLFARYVRSDIDGYPVFLWK
ncbi:MAG: type I-C CRISPR-associated endonuclease Cas1c [Spirochaetia bacterium]|jgi:CRISPR-associated protein Cas1|nr:type I-C CRISPR-associated endonuclease Cas1c [Spirochaetia bacterium]